METYTLAANVEDLELTGPPILTGIGNTLNNIIHGNRSATRSPGSRATTR